MTTTPVTIEQAAAIIGVSASTIRRRIKAGTLRVEEARRPQGVVWLVHLPAGTGPASATDTVDTASVTTTATTPAPPGEAIAAIIQATLTPIIAPLVAEIAAHRQAGERKDDTIRTQAETIGELRSERDAAWIEVERLKAAHAQQEALDAARVAQMVTEIPDPPTEPAPQPDPFPAPLPPTPNEQRGLLGPGPLRAVVVVSALVVVLMLAFWLSLLPR